jgi:hypothetical protein
MSIASPTASSVWLSRSELADRRQLPKGTLDQWASRKPPYGPKYALFGRHVRYRLDHILSWEDAQFGDELTAEPTGAIPARD